MAVDDPPIPCVGSVHVPGCVHLTPKPIASERPRPSLDLVFRVRVTRRGRHRCPGCGKVRQLVALTSFAEDQPTGYGTALCRACGDLRPS